MQSDQMSIGEFARYSRLSPKALWLYDELGLLEPARVDEDSGYRYYSAFRGRSSARQTTDRGSSAARRATRASAPAEVTIDDPISVAGSGPAATA